MKPCTTIIQTMCLALLLIGLPVSTPATSYLPQDMLRETQTEQVTGRTEGILYMFYGGKERMNKTIVIGDIITVYRENDLCSMVEVGKVRIVGVQQELYATAVVIEGKLQPGDVVRKNGWAAMIVPMKSCRERQ